MVTTAKARLNCQQTDAKETRFRSLPIGELHAKRNGRPSAIGNHQAKPDRERPRGLSSFIQIGVITGAFRTRQTRLISSTTKVWPAASVMYPTLTVLQISRNSFAPF